MKKIRSLPLYQDETSPVLRKTASSTQQKPFRQAYSLVLKKEQS
ncbi:Hypothetical protein Minf_1803 [Methylacidiphilum infernorum V4]|uniref:Uncharacterized protein n=1 Tax=Methylacidiphilum infernorum (isolate V4) TaxID=481448 RepID=B3DXE8_METI4|nr:Hypothetical protein Minf_1803 [Methylacidiphilum infernorum V4]